MFTLVRKTVTTGEFAKSETFSTFNNALKEFYQYLSNNVADTSVKRFDITILNGDLIPCKTDHYTRDVIDEEPVEEIPTEEAVAPED